MAEIGYFLSSEEHGPAELLRQAQQAEEAVEVMRKLWEGSCPCPAPSSRPPSWSPRTSWPR